MDTRQLAELLDLSLRLWAVSGRASAEDRHHVLVRLTSGARMRIARRDAPGERSSWRASPVAGDTPHTSLAPFECSSLGTLLKRLRMTLDPDFVPARAIIGLVPPSQSGSRQ